MSFCIAELELPRGRRELAVVHRRWISGEQFYYPNFWRKKPELIEALKSGWIPDSKVWLLYKGHIVGNRFYETYEKAEMLLSKAENGSDFSSSEENGRKRKCRTLVNPANQSHVLEGSDSDEDTLQNSTQSNFTVTLPPPPFPTTSMGNTAQQFSGPSLVAVNFNTDCSDSARASGETSGANFDGAPFEIQDVEGAIGNAHTLLQSTNNIMQSQYSTTYTPPTFGSSDLLSTPGHQRSNFGSAAVLTSPMPNTMNLRGMSNAISTLQQGQLILTAKVDMALDMLRSLIQSTTSPKATNLQSVSIPMTSIEEFDSLNSTAIKDKTCRNSLIDMLGVKGGNTSNQVTYRVMSALMTNQLMTSFTMAGQKDGKKSFKDSVFLQCVCDAVRRSPKGSVATDKEIEGAVEYWLKKAKSRIDVESKRAMRNSDSNAAADDSIDME